MKIGPFEAMSMPALAGVERKNTSAGRSEATRASTEVRLSSMTDLKVDADGEGSFDAAKVERITQAIRDGKFSVNAGAIADQLIANAQELLDRTPRS